MPELGKKYNCYSCHTKFYDLGKPVPLCPKCGADQRDAEEAPLYTPARGRARVVEQPVEDEGFGENAEQTTETEEEGFTAAEEPEEEADEEEEEEY